MPKAPLQVETWLWGAHLHSARRYTTLHEGYDSNRQVTAGTHRASCSAPLERATTGSSRKVGSTTTPMLRRAAKCAASAVTICIPCSSTAPWLFDRQAWRKPRAATGGCDRTLHGWGTARRKLATLCIAALHPQTRTTRCARGIQAMPYQLP